MDNSNLINAILISLLFGSLSIILINYLNRVKIQLDCEEEFVKQHEDGMNQRQRPRASGPTFLLLTGLKFKYFSRKEKIELPKNLFFCHRDLVESIVPLKFFNREPKNLLNLCEQSSSKWTRQYLNVQKLKISQPSIEVHRLGFRRLGKVQIRPVLIEIIRCSIKYAIIGIGDGTSGYVLERHEQKLSTSKKDDEDLFYIHAKFYYRREIESSENDQSISGQSAQEKRTMGQETTESSQYRSQRTHRARRRRDD